MLSNGYCCNWFIMFSFFAGKNLDGSGVDGGVESSESADVRVVHTKIGYSQRMRWHVGILTIAQRHLFS